MNHPIRTRGVSMALAAMMAFSSVPALAAETTPETTDVTALAETKNDVGYVYATVNMPYADFYYGELQDIAAGTETEPQLTVADPVEAIGYRAEGMYDVVTSATSQKSQRYACTYFDANGTIAGGTDVIGLKDVPIAIPADLYANAQAAIADNQACSNQLLDFISSATLTDTVPTEYKVLNADGTFSKMVTETETPANASASITSNSVWGHYQISVEGISDIVTTDNMMGVVLETKEGVKYGMEHVDNLWLRTGEFAFTVSDFTEPHGNKVDYQRTQDIQGKTITKITYLLKDRADMVIPTNLLVKYQTDATAAVTDSTVTDPTSEVTITAPADANYELAAISGLEASQYTYKDGKLTLPKDATPGAYTATFVSDKYVDITATFNLNTAVKAEDINIVHNKVVITDKNLDLATYIAAVTGVTVDGETPRGGTGAAVINEDGSINFSAMTSGRGGSNPIFANGAEGDYELTLTAPGYPTVTAKVGKSAADEHVYGVEKVIKKATLSANGSLGKECVAGDGDVQKTATIYKIKSVKASKTSFTYNSKVCKPTVKVTDSKGKTVSSKYYTLKYSNKSSKKIGKYTVKVTFKTRYFGSKTLTYTIAPAKTTTKLSSATKNSMKVQWSKVSGDIGGYEIQYSTSPKFTSKTTRTAKASAKSTSTTLKNLSKNKKYYVRVRSYKKVSGNIYSSWSVVKNLKTKK